MSNTKRDYAKEKLVLIIDFGSQYTAIIARKIRALNIYCEIIPCFKFKISDYDSNIGAYILSGGPNSVYEQGAPHIDKKIFETGVPILGICYGMQIILQNFGSKVHGDGVREFGDTKIRSKSHSLLTDNFFIDESVGVWMSHGDSVQSLPNGFVLVAESENGNMAIAQNFEKKIYCLQFHPEVEHTKNGIKILENFLKKIANIQENWSAANLVESKIDFIKEQTSSDDMPIIAGVSGGVDSTVASILVSKAVGDRLKCIFVDTGFMRLDEVDEVQKIFASNNIKLETLDASELFLEKLRGISDPEQKRKIIGGLFIDVFENAKKKYINNGQDSSNKAYLMQGTLYTDIIESVSANGGPSHTIKSHHNVGGLPEKMNFKLIEPLKDLFKDEVRALGLSLDIDSSFINRHPFPGPGLAIRIDGEVTPEKLDILKKADKIFISSLKEFGIYDKIWQAFVFLTDMRSVGVMGDCRTYERACVLRAIVSNDGMTADVFDMPYDFIKTIASRIVNNVRGINRVFYDYTTKPPATIEFQ